MKKLILCLGDVPHTGRTTFCEALQEMWLLRSMNHLRFHTAENQPNSPGFSTAFDWSTQFSIDQLIEWLEDSPLVLIDAATGSTDEVLHHFASEEIFDVLTEMDCSLTVISSITQNSLTEACLLKIAEQFRNDAEYVIVRQGADQPALSYWQLPPCQRAMHHLDGVTVPLPAWPTIFQDPEALAFSHVLNLLAHHSELPRTTQTLLHSWWLQYGESLSAASELLWPTELMATSSQAHWMRMPLKGRTRRQSSLFS